MIVGIVLNSQKQRSVLLARELLDKLKQLDIQVWTEYENHEHRNRHQADLVIVLGGDGTILRAAREYSPRGIPLLGVNLGKVGFLAELQSGEVDAYLRRLVSGDFHIEERLMLQVKVKKKAQPAASYLALNDAVIRSEAVRIVELSINVDNQPLGKCRGDGIICATPTGSTGYSLAAGGPVLLPDVSSLVITPICSYNLANRPLVVDAGQRISVSLDNYRTAVLAIDGQLEVPLMPGDLVEYTGAAVKTRLVRFKTKTGWQVLGTRLYQGGE